MTDITIAEVTDGSATGTGAFDKMMEGLEAHLIEEYQAGRITGTEYATVYLGALQTAMAQAVQYVLGRQSASKQGDLLAQKIATEEAQTLDTTTSGSTPAPTVAGLIGKQKLLLGKQTDGFDRDAEQKVLKIMMDAYTVQRSTDSALGPPSKADNEDINQFIIKAAAGIAVTLDSTFTIGGTVVGLTATGLILQIAVNNGTPGDNLPITADGTFTFATALTGFVDPTPGDTYAVSILQQPTGLTCTIDSGGDIEDSGTATSGSATVLTDTSKAWTTNEWVGRKVTDVTTGNSALITANDATTLTVASITGGFTAGDSYQIGNDGAGQVVDGNVTNISISCA